MSCKRAVIAFTDANMYCTRLQWRNAMF